MSRCHNVMTLRHYVLLRHTLIKFAMHRSFFPKRCGRIHRCPYRHQLPYWILFKWKCVHLRVIAKNSCDVHEKVEILYIFSVFLSIWMYRFGKVLLVCIRTWAGNIEGSLIGRSNHRLTEMTATDINRIKGFPPYKHDLFILLYLSDLWHIPKMWRTSFFWLSYWKCLQL